MLHFVTSYMKQNKSCKQALESVQYELEISFNCQIMGIIIHSKYFPVSDWLKPHT